MRLTVEQRALAFRLRAEGWTLRAIAREIGCVYESVRYCVSGRHVTPARPDVAWTPRKGCLTLADREEILLGLARNESFTLIASRIAKSVSSVSREVGANGGRAGYRAWLGHHRAARRTLRPKPSKLDKGPLATQVTEWLEKLWSPEEIAHRLPIVYPDDLGMRVSHETIYQTLFVQGRGELRRELHRCLRTGRAQRRHPGSSKREHIAGMVNISVRPPEAADRAVPGHWEGDLIIGARQGSAIGTLVERSTRFVILLHLPTGRDATSVETAMKKAIATLPGNLMKSITWDQGKELARHASFTLDTGIPIYFCDPHSPWQRGTNENTNGLLRQYLPKGTDLSVHNPEHLTWIAASLNDRPRETLGYMTPLEKLNQLLALTT